MIISQARKKHLCELCAKWIKTGQYYHRIPKGGGALCIQCKRRLEKKEVRS